MNRAPWPPPPIVRRLIGATDETRIEQEPRIKHGSNTDSMRNEALAVEEKNR